MTSTTTAPFDDFTPDQFTDRQAIGGFLFIVLLICVAMLLHRSGKAER